MSVASSKTWSRSSTASGKSLRSGKSLAERIRELGFGHRVERIPTYVTSQLVEIKFERNLSSDYSIMTPNLNLEQITYFQPELDIEESAPGKYIYKISKFETQEKGTKEVFRISDIEVKSYRPNKKMKFRKKKRQSSIINRIEEILHKGKPAPPTRESSEESVNIEPRQEETEKTINDLPESILLRIFSLFSMKERNLLLSRVCKSWYYLVRDPMFWTELSFNGSKVPKKTIIELIRRYPLIKKLSFIAVPEVDEILLELCRCNHNITNLEVKNCDVGSQDFARIILHVVSCCSDLEDLNVKGMRFHSERFFLELGRLKNFRSLNLTGNNMVKSQDLVTLSVNCRTLQELRILDITPEGGPGCLKDENLTFIVFHLQQNLRTLKLDMQQLRNVSYQAILKCSNLTNLVMLNCLHLSSDTFRQLPALEHLRKLKLTRAINLKSEDFEFVFDTGVFKLEDLNINGCWGVGEIGLQAITQRQTSLKSLSLKNCKKIKGEHLIHLSLCPELSHLNIAHTEVGSNCLAALCQHAKALSSLVIDSNMYDKSAIQTLRDNFPSLEITLSFSQYQKDERPLDRH